MKHLFTRFLLACTAVLLLTTPLFATSLPAPVHTEPDPATVKSAVASFKALSKREKRERMKEVKKYLKEVKAAKRAGQAPEDNTVLLVILAILLPPLAVYLHQGEINNKFWISLVLTLLFWLPGVIYALVVVLGAA
jgi:uncharacterized membrane protein YqaE (UPF0057 family)